MMTFGSSDLEKILGVKAHIIRYWEKEIPLIQPRKDGAGKLIYSKKDVRCLLRIKHLTQQRKYTLEGAKEQLYREQDEARKADVFEVNELRSDLLDIYLLNREQKKALRDYCVQEA